MADAILYKHCKINHCGDTFEGMIIKDSINRGYYILSNDSRVGWAVDTHCYSQYLQPFRYKYGWWVAHLGSVYTSPVLREDLGEL